MRRSALLLLPGLALGLLAGRADPVAAQQDVFMVQRSPAWLGISYDARWVLQGGSCTPQVLIQAVVQGSPAERAGLRAGDAIVALNGDPVPPGRLQALAPRLTPGDSVRLRFLRNGQSREVTAVADRRPERPLTVYVESSPSYRSMGTPVIEVVGDTLIARNAADWDPGRARSYWVREPDGRTEYHVIGGWATTELDQRVTDLLACADSTRFTIPEWEQQPGEVRVTLRQLQERADSMRVAWGVRGVVLTDSLAADSMWVGLTADSLPALLRREGDRSRGLVRVEPTPGQSEFRLFRSDSGAIAVIRGPDSNAIHITSPNLSYTFRVEDHVAAGLRGVAGAELSALEPELADYFRNVDEGLLVLRIAPDTPADRAGLRPGDVVIAADGRRVETVAELRQIVALPTANAVALRVIRRGRTLDLTLRRN